MTFLVVDDQQVFRKAFVLLLKAIISPAITCVEAGNGREALAELKTSHFDLVFLDVCMPEMDGIEACKIIKTDYPKLQVIILTAFANSSLMCHFYESGVSSFLTKNAEVDEIIAAVDNAIIGEKYFPRTQQVDKDQFQKVDLSPQERHLLYLLHRGQTSKEISIAMKVTTKTVNTYRERLLEKTNTSNVAELVSFGFETGILF
jgi:two-component system invasion response regulator UvrY